MGNNQQDNQQPRNVKIEVIRPIRIGLGKEAKTYSPSTDPKKPTIVSVSENDAKEFCDKSFKGYSSESGERSTAFPTVKIYRAKRVKDSQ